MPDYREWETENLKIARKNLKVCWAGCTKQDSDIQWAKLLEIERVLRERGCLEYATYNVD